MIVKMKLVNWKHLVAIVYYYYERPSLILLLFYKTSHILMITDIWKYWNFYGKGNLLNIIVLVRINGFITLEG